MLCFSLIVTEDEQWRRWKIFLIVTVIIRITQLFLFLTPNIILDI